MNRLIFIIVITLSGACSDKIEITNEYISNKYWDDYNSSIKIQRMIVVDKSLDIKANNFRNEYYFEIQSKLEVDSSFEYVNWDLVPENRPDENDTVYFNQFNGSYWFMGDAKKKTIGNLENNTWYKFSNLRMNTKYFMYVYVDSIGTTHSYVINIANF